MAYDLSEYGRPASFHRIMTVHWERIDEKREEMIKFSLIALVGFICATMFAIGLGFVVPVSSAVGGVCYVLAVASGVFFVGLLDGE